jgi:hypothetical protein
MLDGNSQVLCGPFLEEDIPDYQAAMTHYITHWSKTLSPLQGELIQAIIGWTARFARRWTRDACTFATFMQGALPNPETGFAGVPPLTPVSAAAFSKARKELIAYGVIQQTEQGHYSVNYAITCLDLVEHATVRDRMRKHATNGSILSTDEGIQQWALQRAMFSQTLNTENKSSNASQNAEKALSSSPCSQTLQDQCSKTSARSTSLNNGNTTKKKNGSTNSCNEPEQTSVTSGSEATSTKKKPSPTPPDGNTTSQPMSVFYKEKSTPQHQLTLRLSLYRNISSFDISQEEISRIKNEVYLMSKGKRSAADILADVSASVDGKREALVAKRRTRMTLADRVVLFERSWMRGQRERSSDIPPNRFVNRDKKLLKDQLLKPAEGTKLDIEEFAYWVALNWTSIGAKYFTKTRKYPANPAFGWMIRCLETYTLAYQEREYLEDVTIDRKDIERRERRKDESVEARIERERRKDDELAALRAELAEANEELRQAARRGRVRKTDLDREIEKAGKPKRGRIDPKKYNDKLKGW